MVIYIILWAIGAAIIDHCERTGEHHINGGGTALYLLALIIPIFLAFVGAL